MLVPSGAGRENVLLEFLLVNAFGQRLEERQRVFVAQEHIEEMTHLLRFPSGFRESHFQECNPRVESPAPSPRQSLIGMSGTRFGRAVGWPPFIEPPVVGRCPAAGAFREIIRAEGSQGSREDNVFR